jgi:hypothetical protein
MKLSGALIALIAWSLVPPAAAQKCVGLVQNQASAPRALAAFIDSLLALNPPCGSAKAVLARVVSRDKTGGRKLEADRPLDLARAQANLDAALRDPAVRARLDKARTETADANVLLAYEATILDDEGFYDARDLKLQQLLQRLDAVTG